MRVLLYADWQPALPFLEPIYDRFTNPDLGWDVAIYFRSHNPVDRAARKLMEGRGYVFTDRIGPYDWVICCDELSGAPNTNRINVFHGPGSKSNTYCKNRQNPTGLHVAFSDYYADLLITKMLIPRERVIMGGLARFDPLTDEDLKPSGRATPRVLYAPTFNPPLSAITILGDSINEIEHVEHRHHVIVNHENPNMTTDIECCYGDDKSESSLKLMADADVVIADSGSMVIEAVALGKMTIQVTDPESVRAFHAKKGTTGRDFDEIPEVHIGRYALQAHDIEDVKRIISYWGKTWARPDFPVIDNIGNYRVSSILADYIRGRS